MSITYGDLRSRIGHKAGYGTTVSGFDADQAAQAELALASALSRFFDPMILPGEREKHQWSFLTPTVQIELNANVYAYDLPANFVSFEGPLVYEPGTNAWYEPIEIMGAGEVQKRLARSAASTVPAVGGVRIKAGQEVHATQWELIVHPVPNGTYRVKAPMRINPTVPGATTDVPLGGQPHEHTLIAACIAETIALLVDEGDGGQSEQRFVEALRSSISHDRHVSGAHVLGYCSDPGIYSSGSPYMDHCNIPLLTYQGATW